MTTAGPITRARDNLTGIVSTLVTGVWLAGLFTGQDWWLAFMLVGYIIVVPLTALLFGDREDMAEWWEDDDASSETTRDSQPTTQDDALETLRERYARGELTDEQFERKVDQLIETETIEDIEDRPRDDAVDQPERASERESELN